MKIRLIETHKSGQARKYKLQIKVLWFWLTIYSDYHYGDMIEEYYNWTKKTTITVLEKNYD